LFTLSFEGPRPSRRVLFKTHPPKQKRPIVRPAAGETLGFIFVIC
jgi:hypothetical protein